MKILLVTFLKFIANFPISKKNYFCYQ
jgi:hypothetical protein